ncbi:MAG TPA: SDR family NAD(P)-dependent oxidoreductase, partial [Phenylobacterium sp.]|nr:SDR family NAD(P)-dependent oxidoreductase [Phenylobacterium sp.]
MGRIWFITGVSSGLGLALAQAVLASGDTVAGTVRKAADAEAFADLGPGAHPFVADVTDEAAVQAAVAGAQALAGRIDILVNNAGIGVGADDRKTVDEFPVETWDEIITIDLTGVFLVGRKVAA